MYYGQGVSSYCGRRVSSYCGQRISSYCGQGIRWYYGRGISSYCHQGNVNRNIYLRPTTFWHLNRNGLCLIGPCISSGLLFKHRPTLWTLCPLTQLVRFTAQRISVPVLFTRPILCHIVVRAQNRNPTSEHTFWVLKVDQPFERGMVRTQQKWYPI